MTDRGAAEAALLRPAIEWAVIVARQDQSGEVVVPAPAGMRPYLRFHRLPARAVRAVRVSIEGDAEFRARVAEAAGPEEIGRAAWLWLTRPDEWEDEFEALVDAETDRLAAHVEDDAERSAVRQLQRAEATSARWEVRAGELETELQRLRDGLAAETARADELSMRLDEAASDADRLADERARAVRELKEMEGRLQGRDAELRSLREAGAETPPPIPDPFPVAEPEIDRLAVAGLAARALAGLDAIDAALSELSELVASPRDSGASVTPSIQARRMRRIGRGLAEDSTEAARWLLELDDVVVLVDAYNLTMATWPDLTASEQRRTLERGLVALGGRTGARFTVVYDGDDVVAAPGPRQPGVDVRFTAADLEADDEILRLVEIVPVERPVVVVSDDHRVRDGARERGANVVGSRQLRPLLLA